MMTYEGDCVNDMSGEKILAVNNKRLNERICCNYYLVRSHMPTKRRGKTHESIEKFKCEHHMQVEVIIFQL